MKLSFILGATLVVLLCANLITAATVVVQTKLGPIEGRVSESGNRAFLGIKYAESKRWEWPTPVEPWREVLPATDPAKFPSCPQICQLPKETCPPEAVITEDCLALNIFTPANPTGSRLPVVVWFHGGRYMQGYGGGDLYWGEEMALNAIFVSVNYRLGVLGYMYNEEMGIKGNFGLKDQIMSLEFVRHVIADFGGDPNKVTISGQSAGAGSVAAILASPSTHGLYSGAILYSNPFTIPMREPADQKPFSEAFMKIAECKTRECLNELPLSTIYTAQDAAIKDIGAILSGMIHMFLPYTPTVGTPDGLLPMQPMKAFVEGLVPENVSVIFGTTSNEAPMFIYGAAEKPVNADAYKVFLLGILGVERQAKVLARFPAHADPEHDHRPILVQIANEYIFEYVNTWLALKTMGARKNPENKYKVYAYLYSHVFSDPAIWDMLADLCGKQACHAAELAILFKSTHIINRPTGSISYTPDEIQFSAQLRKYLTNFSWTGNPNLGPVKPNQKWASFYSGKQRIHMDVNQWEMIEPNLETQAYWDDVGYL